MKVNAEKDGIKWSQRSDERVISVIFEKPELMNYHNF